MYQKDLGYVTVEEEKRINRSRIQRQHVIHYILLLLLSKRREAASNYRTHQ